MILLSPAFAAEITVWHAYRKQEEAALRALAEQFEDHDVRLVSVPFGAFDSKLETAIPRGNGPDLFIAGHSTLGKWSNMGLLQPWPDEDLSPYLDTTVEAMQRDGSTWGLPLAFKSLVLLYDPIRIRTPPSTVEEMVQLAKEQSGDGRYGLVYQAAEPYFHAPWVHGYGGAMLEDGVATLDTPAQVKALELARRLAVDEGIAPQQPTAELVAKLYDDGRASMVISGPWFLSDIRRSIAAVPLPDLADGEPARPFLTVDAAFLAAQSSEPDAARAFARYLAGPVGARARATQGNQAVSLADFPTRNPTLRALAHQARTAVPMPTDPALATAFEAQARALRDVLRGAVEPAQAAENAQGVYEVLARPPPPAVSPWPYIALITTVVLGWLMWLCAPLRDPAVRARVVAHKSDYLWILPAGVAMSILVMTPFLLGASVSLFAHSAGEWSFVGFAHFGDLLLARDWPVTSPLSFFSTLVVTVLWTLTNLTLHVGLGVALALVLREPWIRMRGIWRALLILPWAVPNYITALIWKGMFHAQYGAVNAVLGTVAGYDGPAPIDWFGSFALGFTANLTTNTWLGFPFMMVVTLGALQSIPRELEEAAEIDGAGWWFRFSNVTWPLLKPALMPAVILGSVWTFNMFNVVFLVSQGEPNSSTEILISDAYRWAFSRGNRYGYASAYAVLIFFVLLAYARGANRIAGRKVL